MSIRANPAYIGLFMIGATILSATGVATLAATNWGPKRSTFISFFQESVNGLENGAPVKFQGVPIGTVTGILIQIDERDKTFQVPVQYEIDLTRLTTRTGRHVDLGDAAVREQQFADGLRAQLQMESVVTGKLYLELSYRADAPPPELEARATAWPEIPTAPSLLAALGTGAGSLVADMLKVLFQVNEMLAKVDMQGINASVVASAKAVERLVEEPAIRASLQQLPGMIAQVNVTMTELGSLAARANAGMDPLQKRLEGASEDVSATLMTMRKTLEELHGLLSTDHGIGHGFQETLAKLKEAADALRLLATSLEQNPDMLLRGKKPD